MSFWIWGTIILGSLLIVVMAFKGPKEKPETVGTKVGDLPPEEKVEISEPLMKRMIENLCGSQRSWNPKESLTKFELHWLQWRLKNGRPACIDCEEGDYQEGPSAGVSMNLKCNNKDCGSEINVHGWGLGAQRLTEPSPNKRQELVSFGPHR